MGPDLTDVGLRRNAVELERALLDPAADVAPSNRTYRVVMKDGSVVTGRLLEDGDGTDLEWLFAARGEATVRDWFERRGARSLSRRSRLYWSHVLGSAAPASPDVARALWPLA